MSDGHATSQRVWIVFGIGDYNDHYYGTFSSAQKAEEWITKYREKYPFLERDRFNIAMEDVDDFTV